MNLLDWLEFGKVSAERDELLLKYFYDNGVLKKIIESKLSFLILGRKGAGKTAVFKFLTENPTHSITPKDILVPLSFDNYNWNIHSLLTNDDKAESHAYRQSWKFVILIEAIKCLSEHYKKNGKNVPNEIEKAHKILEKLFDSPVPSIYNIIGKKILSLSKFSLPKAGLDLEDGSFDSLELGGGEIAFEEVKGDKSLQQALSENIENLIKILDKALQSVQLKDFSIFVCFDKVDEAWDEVSYDSSKKVIAGLVSACDSLTIQYKGFLRPIIFLREDIFEVLSLNDSNKLREDCGELLHWNRVSIQKMVLARVNHFAKENDIDLYNELESIFESKEMRQRAKPLNYIIKRTMMRPRDIIAFLGRILDAMNDKANDPFVDTTIEFTHIDSESIYSAEAGYSEWLRQEILDEWSVQNPIIIELLNSLRNNSSTNFTAAELDAELEKLRPETKQSEIFDHLKFLFDNSIIGFKLGSSPEWRFKCFYPSQGFVVSPEYRVHEGLVRALNLKENRE
ncbi:MAG: ATPase [Bacteroidia bacterium]|nr:ATPase [Bacteroidia bacterium]